MPRGVYVRTSKSTGKKWTPEHRRNYTAWLEKRKKGTAATGDKTRAAIAYLKQWERRHEGKKLSADDLLVMLAMKTLIGEL